MTISAVLPPIHNDVHDVLDLLWEYLSATVIVHVLLAHVVRKFLLLLRIDFSVQQNLTSDEALSVFGYLRPVIFYISLVKDLLKHVVVVVHKLLPDFVFGETRVEIHHLRGHDVPHAFLVYRGETFVV